MAKYMVQAAYSPDGLKGLVKDGGTGRRTAIEAAVKGLGGRLESLYFAFDQADVYAIVDMPDNVSAASFALAVGPTGALSHFRTVVLLTPEEVDQAAKKAAGASYRAPGH
jgi:uncharacterized protein with GYD domain